MRIASRPPRASSCWFSPVSSALLFLCGVGLPALFWPACSLLLKADAVQCQDDRDCGHFPNAVCNRTTSLCISRPNWPAPLPDASSGNDASPSDARAGTDVDGAGAGVDAHHDECPDLNNNAVLDCKESLLTNPSFRGDIAGWTAEIDTQEAFVTRDGTDNPASGSIAVINGRRSDNDPGSTMGGSEQCVRATDTASYDFAVQALVAVTPGTMAWAGVAFQFFGSPDCSGTSTGAYSPTLSSTDVTGWQVLRGIVSPPYGTLSALLRLVVVKPFKQPATGAIFDNVLMKAR